MIRYYPETPTSDGIDTNDGGAARQKYGGLDQMVLETFPLIEFAAVKHVRALKSPLECAVCLSEFSEHDILRLLPGCRHVFHTNCIDIWLAEHVTCPVCRSNLSDPAVAVGKSLPSLNLDSDDVASNSHESEQVTTNAMDVETFKHPRRSESPAISGGWERFTLNIPEEVMHEIASAARRFQRSMSMQDYTYQGKASWRDAKVRSFLNCFPLKQQGKRKANLSVEVDVSDALASTSVSNRRLLKCPIGGGDEIIEVDQCMTEIELAYMPAHERV